MSPGWAHWYRRTGSLGCRFLSRPRPIDLSQRPVVESGTARALAMRRIVQRSWRSALACCCCCGLSVRRWLRRTLRRSTSAAAPPERNLASHLYAVRRLIPTWAGQISQRDALVNVSTYKPFPADGCQPGIRVGMHGV